MHRFVIVAGLLLVSRNRPSPEAASAPAARAEAPLVRQRAGPEQLREYRFVHMETTGITSFVVVAGSEIAIEFSKESDPEAVQGLYSLRGEVLFPNARQDRENEGIVLVGALDPEIRHTPTTPAGAKYLMPTSEPYQELRLVGWYLRAPFPRYHHVQTPMDDGVEPAITQRDRLTPDDFERPIRGDLARFVRAR